MGKQPKKRKKLEYPEETNGTRWAAEARKLTSKMTAAERAEHFRQAMVKIYGGELKKSSWLSTLTCCWTWLRARISHKSFERNFKRVAMNSWCRQRVRQSC